MDRLLKYIYPVVAGVIFLCFIAFAATGENGWLRLWELKGLHAELVEQNRELLYVNLAYRQKQKSLSNWNTIERRARDSFGMAYPDETVFLVPIQISSAPTPK